MQRGCLTLFSCCPIRQRGFRIELARYSDQAGIREVAEQASEEVYNEPYDVRKRPALFKEFGQKNAVFLTARLDGAIIGYAKMIIHETDGGEKNAFLAKLYFLKQYCRQGYGTQMMERCLQEAVNHGANMMYLYVWTKNEPAIKFYQKFHFYLGRKCQRTW